MRIARIAGALVAGAASILSACTVVPQAAWNFDPTQPLPKPAIATADAVQLTSRIAELNIEKSEIRSRIASERDAGARLRYYEQLHRVGVELSPLERRSSMYAAAR